LSKFHQERQIFLDLDVRADFLLPRQHSLDHYLSCIQMFGALNGLCSSITESKHIKAVKHPWRCSNRWKALGQILITNQRLDKLAAAQVDFNERGMLDGPLICFLAPNADLPCHEHDGAPAHITAPGHDPSDLEVAAKDTEVEAVGGKRYEGEVKLAVTRGM
jgi:hypothetical protein